MDIIVTVTLCADGEQVGAPVVEHIPLGRYLAGLNAAQQGQVLQSMIKCVLLDEAVFQAAIAAIWYGEDE